MPHWRQTYAKKIGKNKNINQHNKTERGLLRNKKKVETWYVYVRACVLGNAAVFFRCFFDIKMKKPYGHI